MFDWLGHSRGNEAVVRMAEAMLRVTGAALGDARARTRDIRGQGNTTSFTKAVIRNLHQPVINGPGGTRHFPKPREVLAAAQPSV